jgi:hypothetical protein
MCAGSFFCQQLREERQSRGTPTMRQQGQDQEALSVWGLVQATGFPSQRQRFSRTAAIAQSGAGGLA